MLDNQLLQHTLYAVAIVIASALLGRVIKFLLNTLFKKIFAQTRTNLDDLLLDVLRGRVTTLSIIGGTYIGLREIEKGISFSNTTALQIISYFDIALFVFLVFVLARLIIKIVQTTFTWYLDDVARKTHATITPTIAPLTSKIINILLFLIAFMIVLDHFGVNIGSLLVSLGVGSLAFALAAQETIANMIAGFVILIDQPFRVGDRIKLPTGEEGDVMQIGLRSTRVIAVDNNMLVIPNSDLVKNRILNFTFPGKAMRTVIDVGVSHTTDIPKAKELLSKIIKEQSGLSPEFPIIIQVNAITESSIILRLVIESEDFGERFGIESDIRERILSEFSSSGISIAYPQRVIHLTNANELKDSKS